MQPKFDLFCWWNARAKRRWADWGSAGRVIKGAERFAAWLEPDCSRLRALMGDGHRNYRKCRPDIRVMWVLAPLGPQKCVRNSGRASENRLRRSRNRDQRRKSSKATRPRWVYVWQHIDKARIQKYFQSSPKARWEWEVDWLSSYIYAVKLFYWCKKLTEKSAAEHCNICWCLSLCWLQLPISFWQS